jgi:hypothetical protein
MEIIFLKKEGNFLVKSGKVFPNLRFLAIIKGRDTLYSFLSSLTFSPPSPYLKVKGGEGKFLVDKVSSKKYNYFINIKKGRDVYLTNSTGI